jgi:hypothetical protein
LRPSDAKTRILAAPRVGNGAYCAARCRTANLRYFLSMIAGLKNKDTETPWRQKALLDEAVRRTGISMSAYVWLAIREKMQRDG